MGADSLIFFISPFPLIIARMVPSYYRHPINTLKKRRSEYMTKPPSWGSSPEQGQRAQLLPTELLLDCTWIMLDTTRPVTAPPHHQPLTQG